MGNEQGKQSVKDLQHKNSDDKKKQQLWSDYKLPSDQNQVAEYMQVISYKDEDLENS